MSRYVLKCTCGWKTRKKFKLGNRASQYNAIHSATNKFVEHIRKMKKKKRGKKRHCVKGSSIKY